MAKIQNLEKVLKILKDKADAQNNPPAVIVGYTSQIAIFVHENLEMKLQGQPRPSGIGVYWGPHGSSKFLEAPARELAGELGQMIKKAVSRGATLMQALFMAGLRLQRESMKRTPVEYGALRASAFCRKEE